MNAIETILRQLAENFRVALAYNRQRDDSNRLGTRLLLLAQLRSPGKTHPRNIWVTHGTQGFLPNEFRQNRIKPFLTSVPRPREEYANQGYFLKGGFTREEHVYSVSPDAPAMIAKQAAEEAEAAISSFVAKTGRKLNGIAENMGNMTKASLHGNTTLQNTIRLEFADNSSFNMESDIIINHSVHGKPFNQFPSRFSNVILRGASVEAASEAKVKKLFVKTAAAA